MVLGEVFVKALLVGSGCCVLLIKHLGRSERC
jgi:hypothetical protein